ESVGALAGVGVFDGREQEDLALGAGKAVDLAEDEGELAGLVEGDVGGGVAGGGGEGEGLVELIGPDAAATIEREVPGDAHEPDAEVADVRERALMLHDTDEGVLHNVFGLGGVAED